MVPVAELYFLCRVTFHSAHFTNDRHWGHIPILLQYCGSCPCVRHGPYLPSISVSLQTPGRVELATILAIPLLFQGSSPLSFTLSSQRPLEVQKTRLCVLPPVLPPPLGSCPDTKAKTLASPPSSSCYLLFRACQTLNFFFTKSLPGSWFTPPRPLEIRVCQTLTPHQSILQDES